jgi:hypothetical protein
VLSAPIAAELFEIENLHGADRAPKGGERSVVLKNNFACGFWRTICPRCDAWREMKMRPFPLEKMPTEVV